MEISTTHHHPPPPKCMVLVLPNTPLTILLGLNVFVGSPRQQNRKGLSGDLKITDAMDLVATDFDLLN